MPDRLVPTGSLSLWRQDKIGTDQMTKHRCRKMHARHKGVAPCLSKHACIHEMLTITQQVCVASTALQARQVWESECGRGAGGDSACYTQEAVDDCSWNVQTGNDRCSWTIHFPPVTRLTVDFFGVLSIHCSFDSGKRCICDTHLASLESYVGE